MEEDVRVLLCFPKEGARAATRPLLDALVCRFAESALKLHLVLFDGSMTDASLIAWLRIEVKAVARDAPLVLGGYSRGARLVCALANEARASALVLFAFPFHQMGSPKLRHGLALLLRQSLPTLIAQGSRDPYGSIEELRGYPALPSNIRMHWVQDGNHHFMPRRKSALSLEGNIEASLQAVEGFLNECFQSGDSKSRSEVLGKKND